MKKPRMFLSVLLCTMALSLFGGGAMAASMSSVTNSSIKEKENQVSAAKKEKNALQGSMTNLKKLKKELESQKNNLQTYVEQLDLNLAKVEENISSLKARITVKEGEISEAEQELENAITLEKNQKDSIIANVRLMYENGNSYITDLIVGSNGLGDALNKADYMESIVSYSRGIWENYQNNTKMVELCREKLEIEKEILDTAKAAVEEEQQNLEELIAQKEADLVAYEKDIANKANAIEEYQKEIDAQNEVIKALEKAIDAERKKLIAQNGVVLTYDGGVFKFPMASYTAISSEYGNRKDPFSGITKFHNGVDFAAPKGTAIYAAYDGVVVAASYHYSMGNYVMINHGNDLYTIYMHASALYVKENDVVSRGTTIAAVGTTGNSTGNHLHFSVRKNGSYVSPWNYLSQ